ncbi:MAG: hypothetical protein V2A65_11250 [Candidatus Omnitrophota bacterium]
MTSFGIFISAIGLFCALTATVLLYFGSQGVPWKNQTWDGNSKNEKKHCESRKNMSKTGFILLGIGFLLQLIGLFFD